MDKNETIYVAGHRGMVGSAVVRKLQAEGFTNILTRSRTELDLLDRAAVRAFYEKERPALVVDAAAKVGGIIANYEQPVAFLLQNMTIQNNIIEAAADFGTRKFLFLGSSCIYPKFAPQPISESSLLTGALEPTNDAYALAKITGIKLCQAYAREHGKNFLSAMPTNLYGPNDNFDLHNSHVLPALIRKAHEAKLRGDSTIPIWGTGNPRREFLHVDDVADACFFLLENYDSPEMVNIGCGEDATIREVAQTVCEAVGIGLRHVETRRHPAQAPRHVEDVWPGLEAEDSPARGYPPCLRVVSRVGQGGVGLGGD